MTSSLANKILFSASTSSSLLTSFKVSKSGRIFFQALQDQPFITEVVKFFEGVEQTGVNLVPLDCNLEG